MSYFTSEETKNMVKRLKERVGIKTDQQLADLLGISKSAINTWKTVGRFDVTLIVNTFGVVDLNYIIYGKEEIKTAVDYAEKLRTGTTAGLVAEPHIGYAADYVPGNATMTLLNKTIRAAKESVDNPDVFKNEIFADGDDVSKRLNEWFLEIYGDNPQSFADEYGVDYDILDALLKGIHPLTTELANYLMTSGCDMDWLIYGVGDKYNILSKRGRILTLISKAQKAGTATGYFEKYIKMGKK